MTDDASRAQENMDAVQRLWKMSLADFSKIEEDPSHPLHEHALVVGREMMSPVAAAFRAQTAEVAREYRERLGEWAQKALPPATKTVAESAQSPYQAAFDEFIRTNRRSGAGRADLDAPLVGVSPQTGAEVNFSQETPPDVTVAEVYDAAESVGHQMLGVQKEQLQHMISESKSRNVGAAKDRKIAVSGLVAGVLTFIATVGFGVANLCG